MADLTLDYLFNHLFLPPKLPHSSDHRDGSNVKALANLLLQSIRDLDDLEHYNQWSSLKRMLRTFAEMHHHDYTLSRDALRTALRGLQDGDAIVLHIAVQNSGMIIRKATKEYLVETFEASPPAAEVLAATSALQWDFPSRAVAIPISTFENEAFQDSLIDFLARASIEPVKKYAAIALKAGSFAYENRDTTTPAIIGRLLMALLEANGSRHILSLTRKRIRDDVCWGQGGGGALPWRRSATWLVLRVSLQRFLCFSLGGSLGTLHYKFFISLVLSNLLQDLCEKSSSSDRIAFARTKIARRMAKLDQQRASGTFHGANHIDLLLSKYEKPIRKVVIHANALLDHRWNVTRSEAVRRIPLLPMRASPENTHLSLLFSQTMLRKIRDEELYGRRQRMPTLGQRFRYHSLYSTMKAWEVRQKHSMSDYLDLADFESELSLVIAEAKAGVGELERTCIEVKRNMQRYQDIAFSAYQSDPYQTSLMILMLMELWRIQDAAAIGIHPLLAKYEPGFPRNLLHSLQLIEMEDMRRLYDLEDYLKDRYNAAEFSGKFVFGDINHNSFAVRYFNQCSEMQDIAEEIESADDKALTLKEEEWVMKSAEYRDLQNEAAGTTCLFTENEFGDRIHDGRNCRKHFLERKADRMKIRIHEALLPADATIAKAVVFELRIPEALAEWRDATWQILQLARPSTLSDIPPQMQLRHYPGFVTHMNRITPGITLASRKKSFYNTHYNYVSFPTEFDQVCRPHGLAYNLYDLKQAIWLSRRLETPSFADLCAPAMAPKSLYGSLRKFLHPSFEDFSVSENDVVANQTRCPNTLTVSEYTEFQNLRLGNGVQWLRLLRELASNNLNFGAPEVVTLVSALAITAGPAERNSKLRTTHWVFNDTQFCTAMVAQIQRRLEDVTANWRESQTVECMLILLHRIWALASSPESIISAERQILNVREMTHGWARMLRADIRNATDPETAQKRSKDALMAAILCRKTFLMEASRPDDMLRYDNLACYLECGFTLKENMPKTEGSYVSELPSTLKRLLVYDLKLVHRLEDQIRRSIKAYPMAVNQAVNMMWADGGGSTARLFTPWTFLTESESGWITAKTICDDGMDEKSVHIDLVEGTLLIDGQPIGRLPDEYTKQEFFKQLFGPRVFLTYPSTMLGMSYMLANLFEGHEIHFGYRGDIAFCRARTQSRILEWIPRRFLISKSGDEVPDLPLPLVEGHTHWMDIKRQILEIRPDDARWLNRPAENWTIDLPLSRATRQDATLIDPRSAIFNRIASAIEPFEHKSRMVIFQPRKNNVTVSLPSLELSFAVNADGLLESQQLRAMIDSNQDSGTFCGLESALVLRNNVVAEDRSILVPMGAPEIKQVQQHVKIRIHHNGFYARFAINQELGRLECPPEPRLIYFKAYCHAVTSSVLPDPLTGRTGTDEAMYCLKAGNAQPWAPIDIVSYNLLDSISELTPQRVYYPEELRTLQKVTWKAEFSSGVQHDAFRPLVQQIHSQSNRLRKFHRDAAEPPSSDKNSNQHLLDRAAQRNNCFRLVSQVAGAPANQDTQYLARDQLFSSGASKSYDAAILIKEWSSNFNTSRDLLARLQECPLIQGFDREFDSSLFTDLINTDIAATWGPLFKLCQKSVHAVDQYRLMFVFATIAFDNQVDMELLRSLIAISIMDEFRDLQLPGVSAFHHFRKDQTPSLDLIMKMTKPFKTPYPEDERSLLTGTLMHSKQRRKLEIAQLKHESLADESCKVFSQHLIAQWPCREPTLEGREDLFLFESAKALEAIMPEWERLFDNLILAGHLARVQDLLPLSQPPQSSARLDDSDVEQHIYPTSSIKYVQPSVFELMVRSISTPLNNDTNDRIAKLKLNSSQRIPSEKHLIGIQKSTTHGSFISRTAAPTAHHLIQELKTIVTPFATNKDAVRQQYGKDLVASISALGKTQSSPSKGDTPSYRWLEGHELATTILGMQNTLGYYLEHLRTSLFVEHEWLQQAALVPPIIPITVLESLLSLKTAKTPLSRTFDASVKYAQAMMHLQQLLRVQSAQKRHDAIQLSNEICRIGPTKWSSTEYIDWLLLQIDFNLCIRPDQYEVAQAMIAPGSGANSVLQMNMGQGKSSVIIPMIVAFLADGKNLVRVVVPRPLLVQTAQLLQSRLGGLLGRRVKHIPFSRRSPTDMTSLKEYHDLHLDVLHSRGVVLTLPEHMLSFQLSGLQELSNGNCHQAASMMKIHDWFSRKCRDILDECDHMLAVKTQLIYPSGGQSMVDGHPSRWTVVQDLLKLVRIHLKLLRGDYKRSIEVIERSRGSFPTVYLLNQTVKEALVRRLTDSILNGECVTLVTEGCSSQEQQDIAKFVRDAVFSKAAAKTVAGVLRDSTDARQKLLLLRGMLVHKILLMGLGKRWNVQYGIDPRRDPIAVPFRSKGIPSDSAEFGHPDVSIILTCLSFYYSGLTIAQFLQNISQLAKSDEPVREYDSWIQEVRSLPDSLRSWNAINVEDEAQCAQLWQYLRYQMTVVNFFLNHFVFPRHAKTFERKLVSSGWDLAIHSSALGGNSTTELKENVRPNVHATQPNTARTGSLTVGFSGTNDNRRLLPLNVMQDDLPGLAHTNAEVLTYLLQPRNRRYFPAADHKGRRISEKTFLQKLRGLEIRMLIDAGAQIIELDNIALVRLWLSVDTEAEAGVFFGEDGRARVIYRDAKSQPLAASPYHNNLGPCLVYLE